MPAAVDGGDVEGVGEAVEGQRAGERDDVAAIDQPPPETTLLGVELIEMVARRVLINQRRNLMLGLFDRVTVDMVDLLADRVIAVAIGAAGKREIVSGDIERRAGFAQD